MKHGRPLTAIPRALVLAAAFVPLLCSSAAAQSKPLFGRLAGVVRDGADTPQMGAVVQVIREEQASSAALQFLTNTRGVFQEQSLAPGLYTVRVTLAGFLPTLEQHVRVAPNLTTVLRIKLESMFASLDQLRRPPATPLENDDWKWVLRSAQAMRPVLQWVEEQPAPGGSAIATAPAGSRGRLELTTGTRRTGLPSNLADFAGTAFAYDQLLGSRSHLILAGQMSYDRAPAGGLAMIWLPGGSLSGGARSTLVFRQSKLGPDGRVFRSARLDQSGSTALGDRVLLRYGAEYLLVNFNSSAFSLRPRAEVNLRLNGKWTASLIAAAQPGEALLPERQPQEVEKESGNLGSALDQFDAFPSLLWRNGRPVLESGWHEELSAERKLGARGSLQFALFHDGNSHVAIYGKGGNPAADNLLNDFFLDGFVSDGGALHSWGSRVALRQELAGGLEVRFIYTTADALVPGGSGEVAPGDLPGSLSRQRRHSLSSGVQARLPRLGSRMNAGYTWFDGNLLSSLDSYGESLYQADPYLHVGLRQPLPRFALGRWELLADCQNLLEQGYVPVSGTQSRVVYVPAFRTFRGGLSVQF
ncbi:MAG: carboxypeptidase-like regulatory domain-containing protein [Acidobacteriia bacterium]|nr:carboxypeptidase-like regulatory domain-containing protein [Terriglobia bacterium]